MGNRQEYIKVSYHVLIWIFALLVFVTYVWTTGRSNDATFGAAIDYAAEKANFGSLVPEILFGLGLLLLSVLFKLNGFAKTVREEFVSILYTWWSALCASMLLFAYYFFVHSHSVKCWDAISVALIGYITLFAAFVPAGKWISK